MTNGAKPGGEPSGDASAFAHDADRKSTGLLREYFDFLRHSKKWWLLPIIVLLLLVSLLVILGGSAAAPFIYTLF